MLRLFLRPPFATLFILALLLLLSAYIAAAQEDATEEPDSIIVVTSEPFEVTFGPGPFNLLSPTGGLFDLTSYRATLIVSFEGTSGGQAEQWSRTYTMIVTQDPPARQLTIDSSDQPDGQTIQAEVNGTFYEWQEGGTCVASAIEAGPSLAEDWEPAGFLDSVIGAEEAGAETANGISSEHYTFDESAFGASGIADALGELWVASEGGYLVRYTLTITAGADYFGEGLEGTLTWDYQLDGVGLPHVIELPEACPPGLLNVPLLPNAADVLQLPGVTSYTTTSTLEDALAFYQEQVGGQAANPPLRMEDSALFGFTFNDQPLLLVASSDLAGTIIELHQMDDPSQLAITAEVPDTRGVQPEATTPSNTTVSGDTTTVCEPGTSGVPITSDASSMQDMSGALSYMTQMSLTETAAFYEEQLAALGAQVSAPMPANDMMAMFDVRQNDQSYSIILGPVGEMTSVTITSLTGQLSPALTVCTAGSPAATATVVADGAEPTPSGGCPRGVLPLLPDATNIQDIAAMGAISYTTSVTVPEAAAFYEEQFAALGAQVFTQVPATESMASPMFMIDNQPIVLAITSNGDGSTSVSITIMGNNPFRGAAPCAPIPPAPTEVPAPTAAAVVPQYTTMVVCPAGSIAILPDAFNVEDWAGSAAHVTTTSVLDAVVFYEEQLALVGGEVTSSIVDSIGLLTVQQGDHVISVSITPIDEANNGVIITSVSMNPSVSPGDCDVSEQGAAASETTSESSSEVTCTVGTAANANQRSGPGTNFELAGALAAGVSAAVQGQATGADGFVWWQLGEGVWVRSDVVEETGNCEAVPVVQP